jgi:hypothetical protein
VVDENATTTTPDAARGSEVERHTQLEAEAAAHAETETRADERPAEKEEEEEEQRGQAERAAKVAAEAQPDEAADVGEPVDQNRAGSGDAPSSPSPSCPEEAGSGDAGAHSGAEQDITVTETADGAPDGAPMQDVEGPDKRVSEALPEEEVPSRRSPDHAANADHGSPSHFAPATAAVPDAANDAGQRTELPPAPMIEPISNDEIEGLNPAAAAYAKKLAQLSIVLNAREEVGAGARMVNCRLPTATISLNPRDLPFSENS